MKTMPNPGLHAVHAFASADDAGSVRESASFTILGAANLALTLSDVPARVVPGTPFTVQGILRNDGYLPATDVHLDVRFSSSDIGATAPLPIALGTLAGGAEQPISMTLTASGTGVHAFWITASETSGNDATTYMHILTAADHAHTLHLTASQQMVTGRDPVTLTLVLSNTGTIADQVLLQGVSDNPLIEYVIADENGTPLAPPRIVQVPAMQTATFQVRIRPAPWQTGHVHITATSSHDPDARDHQTLTVYDAFHTVYLPLVWR